MMECHEVMRRLWEYLDGALDSATTQEVAEHLAMCSRCFPEYETQMKFLETLARSGRDDPTAVPSEAFKVRLRASLEAIRPRPGPHS